MSFQVATLGPVDCSAFTSLSPALLAAIADQVTLCADDLKKFLPEVTYSRIAKFILYAILALVGVTAMVGGAAILPSAFSVPFSSMVSWVATVLGNPASRPLIKKIICTAIAAVGVGAFAAFGGVQYARRLLNWLNRNNDNPGSDQASNPEIDQASNPEIDQAPNQESDQASNQESDKASNPESDQASSPKSDRPDIDQFSSCPVRTKARRTSSEVRFLRVKNRALRKEKNIWKTANATQMKANDVLERANRTMKEANDALERASRTMKEADDALGRAENAWSEAHEKLISVNNILLQEIVILTNQKNLWNILAEYLVWATPATAGSAKLIQSSRVN
ncbi:hypothetical protein EMPS_03837 [Entomortierella parvispora]|uniref:Uncharacterized protein n=1 Tax=Entomortierella parvispora TaxID=205924 RepID=A0A9P3H7J2_9FUNG|nr:hypothetical protein EMPS_03837 [Entomortierella parvispora]